MGTRRSQPGDNLSQAAIKAIALEYDGTSATIDRLVTRWQVERHKIIRAAKQGGYEPTRKRKTWRAEDDQFLRDHWGRLETGEIAARLGCTILACTLRKKRLGISTRNLEDWTIRDLEDASAGLRIDHRIWHRFIDQGWLKCWRQPRQGASPVTRVSTEAMHEFLAAHPEVIDVVRCDKYARSIFELDRLPQQPRYKLLTCKSQNWTDGVRPTAVGPKAHHGDVQLDQRQHRYSLQSCQDVGGTDFWEPINSMSPSCPRCGCKVSRFSDKGLYRDDEPGDDANLNAIAGKLGLEWRGSEFIDRDGHVVKDEQLLRYVFNTKRAAGKAFEVFQRLLQAGLSVAPRQPIDPAWVQPNILNYELRDDQNEAFGMFLAYGGLSTDSPCGWGKSMSAAYALANVVVPAPDGQGRLPQVVFTDTTTLRDQWIRKYRASAPAVSVKVVWRPHAHVVLRLYDKEGQERVDIHFYNYRTAEDFSGRKLGIVVYDEEHRLPGNRAHRLALVDCAGKFGASASRVREDGRENLLSMMTGQVYRKDWREARAEGTVRDVPVTALIVRSIEDKLAAARSLVRGKRALVFCDSLSDGHRFAQALDAPFIHAATKNKLETIAANRVFVMSRVGDTGLTIPGVQRVIDAVFHKGSRAQSIQRYGRVLHGADGEGHWILMTPQELSRYYKRLSALEEKGCRITLRLFTGRRGRPIETTPSRIGARPHDPWLDLIAGAHLKKAA